jgi:isopentenyl diphosphate isomerase/L-lactate dehydrogenase-like FMN-dependent dehydrogenase
MSEFLRTRRQQLRWIASMLASSTLLDAQQLQGEPPGRITPLAEFVNLLEFEWMAKRKLDAATFATIAGGDRTDFDRITFRPRVMVDSTQLDLTIELFGQTMFAPILIGPASWQGKIHPDGELAMVRGASAAKAAVVFSAHSSVPLEQIAAEAQTPLWFQVFPGPDLQAVRTQIRSALRLGCKAIVITIGTPFETATPAVTKPVPIRWNAIDALRQSIDAPVLIKGVMTAVEADAAVQHGAQGVIVSNYGRRLPSSTLSPVMALPSIADAVGGRIPILIDGGFRRGTDILKALILGAQAVLLSRPALWGMATYGANGVQTVMEMAQTELARNMVMVGAPNLKALSRAMIRIHRERGI